MFHFENKYWLLLLTLIPIIWLLYSKYFTLNEKNNLEHFIDKHLIPHLVKNNSAHLPTWKILTLYSILWSCLALAMAGPRWDYEESETFKNDNSLLILLDLSKSMDSRDILPSRLAKARQIIEDLIDRSKIKIGLVAFATTPHMITPITDDKSNIKHILPYLSTDLIHIQGTNLVPALKSARQMLSTEPTRNKSILIITDGGYQDENLMNHVREIASDIEIHVIGIGSDHGTKIEISNKMIFTRLEKKQLKDIARIGHGQYFDSDSNEILKIVASSDAEKTTYKIKRWNERFYIFLLPILAITFTWFRRGIVLPLILIMMMPIQVQASDISKFFLSKEQYANRALERDKLDIAIDNFEDPYKKGIAYYEAGMYEEAVIAFNNNIRDEARHSSLYNLGNSLAKQQKYKEAIKVYETLLSERDHENARFNLELVKPLVKDNDCGCGNEDKNSSNDRQNNPDKSNDKEKNTEQDNTDAENLEKKESDNNSGSDKNDFNKQENHEEKIEQDSNQNKLNSSDGGDSSNNGKDNSDDIDKQQNKDQNRSSDPSNDKEKNDNDEKQGLEQDNHLDNKNMTPQQDQFDEQQIQSDQVENDKSEIEMNQIVDMIEGDPRQFLKNQFYIESNKSNPTKSSKPW